MPAVDGNVLLPPLPVPDDEPPALADELLELPPLSPAPAALEDELEAALDDEPEAELLPPLPDALDAELDDEPLPPVSGNT